MNQASDMLVIQSLAFFLKKVAIFRKNLKVDNFLNSIKNKTRQKKRAKISSEKYCLVTIRYLSQFNFLSKSSKLQLPFQQFKHLPGSDGRS